MHHERNPPPLTARSKEEKDPLNFDRLFADYSLNPRPFLEVVHTPIAVPVVAISGPQELIIKILKSGQTHPSLRNERFPADIVE